MRQLKACMNCKKSIRFNDRSALVIDSSSLSGSNCFTVLCGKCGHNAKIRERMQKINDLKLELMDGEISLESYRVKLESLLKEEI